MAKISPTTKEILKIASVGAFIAGSLILPGLPKAFNIKKSDWEKFLLEDEWFNFDERRLKQKLKNLQKQKVVKIYEIEGKTVVKITKKGKTRLLKYNLDELKIEKPQIWDRKWRIIAYDIPIGKKNASNALRHALKQLGIYQLQKSVYLYPYPCGDIIEFLREIYGIGENVTYITVGFLENEEAYKQHFQLS